MKSTKGKCYGKRLQRCSALITSPYLYVLSRFLRSMRLAFIFPRNFPSSCFNLVLAAGLFCICNFSWAETALPVKITMRDHGYTMGDMLHIHAELPLRAGEKLDEDSLPLVGRAKPWLDLQSLKWQHRDEKLVLDFTWQLFATVEIAQALKTPEIVLKTAGAKPRALVVPPQSFYYSPVLPYPLKDVKKRANLPPFKFDERTPLTGMLVCLLLATALLIFWLWLKDRLPGLPFRPGSMTRLARQFSHQPTEVLELSHLRAIHAALNQAAGQSLYPHSLDTLFTNAPYLKAEEPMIRAFFTQSWQAIHQMQSATLQSAETLAWIRRAAMAERLFLRRQR